LITSDLPMVACSWLLMAALRGAVAGVGSGVGGVGEGIVLMVGFSVSEVLGVVLGELAGFHMVLNLLHAGG
jgi:hypothetical protein